MAENPAVDIGQHIIPDQVVRVEISRSASSEIVQVRVFVDAVNEPYMFQFDSMDAAIEFYERLWSLRTDSSGDAASHSA